MANEPADEAEPFRSLPDLHRFPAGEGQELVCCPLTGGARVLPAAGVRLLLGCAAFAPLAEHAARLCAGPGREAVRAELAALAAAGLLVSRRQLTGACRGHVGPTAAPARVAALGVPTRDRPASLEACLRSYAASARAYGRGHDFVVVDDSADPATRAANRQALRGVGRDFGVAVRYAGPDERRAFALALARETGLAPEATAFALLGSPDFPVATGASRNALLLDGAGDALLQVDDDTLCRLAPAPGAGAGLALFSGYDPTEFWPLPPGTAPEGDLVGAHERLLGRGLGECVAEAGEGGLDLDRVGAGFFRRAAGGGTVLATMAGVAGDSGMGSPLYLLTLEGGSRDRLLGAEADYARAVRGRQLLRAVPRPTLSDGSFCMALNLGLDHRALLPPFLPVQRNQDGVFGLLLRSCFSGYMGLLPWAVAHRPPAVRPPEFGERATRPHTGQGVQLLVGALAPGPTPAGADRLRALGSALADLAALPEAGFEEQARLLYWNTWGRLTAQLEGLRRRYGGAPAYWAGDVGEVVALLRRRLPERGAWRPADLAEAFGPGRAGAAFQGLVGRFGGLLRDWPEMVAGARALRGRGVRVAAPPV